MPNPQTPGEHRVLIVEDEWFLASDLQAALESLGVDVVALVGDLDEARAELARGSFEIGILDINLRGHHAFELADELQRRGIPFIFATGYSAEVIPERFADVIRWEKPFDPQRLARYISQLGQFGSEAKPSCRPS